MRCYMRLWRCSVFSTLRKFIFSRVNRGHKQSRELFWWGQGQPPYRARGDHQAMARGRRPQHELYLFISLISMQHTHGKTITEQPYIRFSFLFYSSWFHLSIVFPSLWVHPLFRQPKLGMVWFIMLKVLVKWVRIKTLPRVIEDIMKVC